MRSFGPPVAKLWPNIFQYISIYFTKSWFALVCHKVHQKQKLFCERYKLDYLWPSLVTISNAGSSGPEPPQKMFPSEIVIFLGLRLFLCHFGKQVSESIVSQLQNGVSTSSLPPFTVDLLIFKVDPRSNSFIQWIF